ncbi:MAG: hypothetical protein Q8P02_03110 [Candidatus Micrarchaeota archaeon]|nr:hypothetical protein [Candidatus Micrarchaeota archaeon]
MPSDLELWTGLAMAGLFVGVAYYALVMVRSARKRIRAIEDTTYSLASFFGAMSDQLRSVRREAASKASVSDLESGYAAFLGKAMRKKMVVKSRG